MQHHHRSHQQKETRGASHWDISTNTGSASRLRLLANDRSHRIPPTMEWNRGKGTTTTASLPPESVATAAEATATNPRKAGDSPLSASHARPRNAIRGHGSHPPAGAHDGATTRRTDRSSQRGGGSGISAAFTSGCLTWWGERRQLRRRLGVFLSPPDLIWLQLGVLTG